MRLLIVGAGGHGVVVADAAVATQEWAEIVFYDDNFPEPARMESWHVLGTSRPLADVGREFDAALVAIGNNQQRLHLVSTLERAAIPLATIIHPRAVVSDLSEVGAGGMLLANSVVNARARIGKACIINTGAVIEHDCRIGNGVHVAPGATLAASVTVGDASWIGAGATVKEGTIIGTGVTVGLGAAVIGDLEANSVVAGVPAKSILRGPSHPQCSAAKSGE